MTDETNENLFNNNFIYVGKMSILHLYPRTKEHTTKNKSRKETQFQFFMKDNRDNRGQLLELLKCCQVKMALLDQ